MFPSNIILSQTFLLWMVLSIFTTFSDAFAPRSSSWTHHPSNFQKQSQVSSSSRIAPLFATNKSGGKIMKDAEMYRKTVLDKSNEDPKPILVFFSAPWCGPCRLTVPVISQIKQQFSNEIEVVEVCTDDLAEIAEEAGVVSIPTIQFYYQAEKMDTIVGCVAKSVLANSVSKLLEDVSEVASS